ncbi:hypothetical protein DFH08DRAFT_986550 [Mycena albidolilacea]|uniref:Uncharacterized protein n=1 Tax=Mycena albidolilacea TaxID=1033008 RepID=A0AAD6Z1F7_9AGAR|nr:hypothetical protein DFH08DRAFT_986550 [Mycena albidolilacea]
MAKLRSTAFIFVPSWPYHLASSFDDLNPFCSQFPGGDTIFPSPPNSYAKEPAGAQHTFAVELGDIEFAATRWTRGIVNLYSVLSSLLKPNYHTYPALLPSDLSARIKGLCTGISLPLSTTSAVPVSESTPLPAADPSAYEPQDLCPLRPLLRPRPSCPASPLPLLCAHVPSGPHAAAASTYVLQHLFPLRPPMRPFPASTPPRLPVPSRLTPHRRLLGPSCLPAFYAIATLLPPQRLRLHRLPARIRAATPVPSSLAAASTPHAHVVVSPWRSPRSAHASRPRPVATLPPCPLRVTRLAIPRRPLSLRPLLTSQHPPAVSVPADPAPHVTQPHPALVPHTRPVGHSPPRPLRVPALPHIHTAAVPSRPLLRASRPASTHARLRAPVLAPARYRLFATSP